MVDPKPNKFYVYQHIDPRTHLIRYVGKGHGNRAWNFTARHARHKNWIRQLAAENLVPEVVIVEENQTEEKAFELEKLWIAACRSSFQPLTNLTDGGEGLSGYVPTEETRRKLSEANSGKTHSDETRRKMSEALSGPNNHFFGKTHSDETRRKISKANSGPNNYNFGKTFSEEHCRKISKTLSGKTPSDETRRKIAKANTGKKHSDETRRKISKALSGKTHSDEIRRKITESQPARRPVIGKNLATGEEQSFNSAAAAASFIRGYVTHITSCCKGRHKTHKGWSFRYQDKIETEEVQNAS